ncbi:hypothetical protein [Alkalihalobacillus sp. AL-G]|nr:hypothetical protein [Alkalihalobacillus sp. AL-G]WLD91658.1 hypothetical protein MOJ78_11435 [Alkalihalobacillus sp. AL-G]
MSKIRLFTRITRMDLNGIFILYGDAFLLFGIMTKESILYTFNNSGGF